MGTINENSDEKSNQKIQSENPNNVPLLDNAPSVSIPRNRRPKRKLTKSERFWLRFGIFTKAAFKMLAPIAIFCLAFLAVILGVMIGEINDTIKKRIY